MFVTVFYFLDFVHSFIPPVLAVLRPSLVFPCTSTRQLHSDDNVSYPEGPGFESWSEHQLVF